MHVAEGGEDGPEHVLDHGERPLRRRILCEERRSFTDQLPYLFMVLRRRILCEEGEEVLRC